MKNNKNKLDEMQELNLLNIEKNGAWLMFFGLLIAIVIQAIIFQDELLKYTAGETIVLLTGGVYMLGSSLKKGIWARRTPATACANLLISFISSGVFSILFGVINYARLGTLQAAVFSALGFFLFIFILCFIVLTVLAGVYKKRNKTLEEEEKETN